MINGIKDGKHQYWPALLVGNFLYHKEDGRETVEWQRTDRPILIDKYTNKDEQKIFLKSLITVPWLPLKVRGALMKELGLSLREEKRRVEEARTVTLRALIREREAEMRKSGERPDRGSVRDEAVHQVARRFRMTDDALAKRIKRLKKRR